MRRAVCISSSASIEYGRRPVISNAVKQRRRRAHLVRRAPPRTPVARLIRAADDVLELVDRGRHELLRIEQAARRRGTRRPTADAFVDAARRRPLARAGWRPARRRPRRCARPRQSPRPRRRASATRRGRRRSARSRRARAPTRARRRARRADPGGRCRGTGAAGRSASAASTASTRPRSPAHRARAS